MDVTAEFLCNMTLLLLTPFCRRSIKLTVTLSRTISLIIAVVKTQTNSEERQLIAARGCIREVLMGVGDGVASVTMLTFTKRPGPRADTAWAVVG